MKKIVFLCNWGWNPKQALGYYKGLTPDNSGKWEDIVGVETIEEADFFVILADLPAGAGSVDYSRAIYVQQEPTSMYAPQESGIRSKYKLTYDKCHGLPQWWIDKPFNEILDMPFTNKPKKFSCIISGKRITPGHKQRYDFVKKFCEKYPNDIDVYGRGLSREEFGDSYKGVIEDNGTLCKWKGLGDYKYSLCIENYREKNYFTEKLIDAYLAWSMPIYFGCSNMDVLFPQNSYYGIDIYNFGDIDRVKEIIESLISEDQIEEMIVARRRIMFEYNLWNTIHETLIGI